MSKNNKDNIATDIAYAESMILEGGIVPKSLANFLCGFDPDSTRIYYLAKKGKVDVFNFAGGKYFSAIDCVMWRRAQSTIRRKTIERESALIQLGQ
jgi:hypothetical protein